MNRVKVHLNERDSVAFLMVDSMAGNGSFRGVIRLRLQWDSALIDSVSSEGP
jgi:hypothetical protein